MNLKELREEIERLQATLKYAEGTPLLFAYLNSDARLIAIKQTVEAVDTYVSKYEKTDPKEWNKIKELLK